MANQCAQKGITMNATTEVRQSTLSIYGSQHSEVHRVHFRGIVSPSGASKHTKNLGTAQVGPAQNWCALTL
jgi:hypothetical protein